MKKQIILKLIIMANFSLFGQELPEITPLSPNAGAIAKYGEIPVGKFTGVPNIEVPLYTIQSSELQLPLSLNYHAGGNKVSNVASWVGLGWSLNTLPSISRSVNGLPDDEVNGFFFDWNVGNGGWTLLELYTNERPGSTHIWDSYLKDVYNRQADSAPDIFYYNLPNESGKFYYNQESQEFITIPRSNIKIIKEGGPSNTYFRIKTTDGTEYLFDVDENTTTPVTAYISTWKISEIVSATKKDTISFEYLDPLINNRTAYYNYRTEDVAYVRVSTTGGDWGDINTFPGVSTSNSLDSNIIHHRVLSQINFNNGYIKFIENTSERSDYNGGYSLDDISVYNTHDQLISKFKFNYKYLTGDGSGNSCYNASFDKKWMLLRSVEQISNDLSTTLETSFTYDETTIPSCILTPAQDYWGYYNGQTSNLDLIPTLELPSPDYFGNTTFQGANRLPDPAYSQFAIIKKITYPTEGYTEFDFENHLVGSQDLPSQFIKDSNGNTIIGGLRIKEVRNYFSNTESPITKKYKYTMGYDSSVSSGDVFNDPWFIYTDYFYYHYYNLAQCCLYGSSTYFKIRSTGKYQNVSHSSSFVGYENVIVETDDPENSGYTSYKFSDTRDTTTPHPGDSPQANSRFLERGELLEEMTYKRSGATYIPVQKRSMSYAFRSYNSSFSNPWDYSSYSFNWERRQIANISTWELDNMGLTNVDYETYWDNDFTGINIKGEWRGLINETVETYNENGTITKSIAYNYDNTGHHQVTRTETTNSNEELLKTITKYPEDLSQTSPIAALVAQNRVSIPIETETYIDRDDDDIIDDDELLIKQLTNYKEWSTDVILPEYVKTLKGYDPALSEEDRIVFHGYYNNGKVQEVSKADGAHVVYIWGYNESKPIAKIENASYSEVSSQVSNLQTLSDADNDRTQNSSGNEGALRNALESLRGSLPNAMITTYTYDPLIGVTSITNPRGETIYYTYDSLNRLEFVKDANGSILSKNEYHYKNQY